MLVIRSFSLNILLLLLAFNYLPAQPTWQIKTPMPIGKKEITDAVCVLEGKIYILGGTTSNGNISNSLEVYDPATNSWTSLAPYPLSVWRASMAALNGKLYAMGGYQSLSPFPFSPTDKMYAYDPGMDTWTAQQSMLGVRGSAASVVLNGQIHLIGGANNSALNSHHIYDPGSDSWSIAPNNLNEARSGLTAATINGKIYATGGYILSGGVQSKSSAEVFDPATNSWSMVAAMPVTKLGISSAVVQEKLYIFGNENTANVLVYDITSNSWSQSLSLPRNINFAGATVLNEVIYLMGGGAVNLATDGIDDMYCLSPIVSSVDLPDDTWSINVYPNPVSDLLQLAISSTHHTFADQYIVQLYSGTGKLLSQKHSNTTKGTLTISMTHFATGIYWLVLKSSGQQWYHKIVKL